MNKHLWRATGVVTVLVSALFLLVAARPAHASRATARAAQVGGLDTTDVIAQNGFGDRQNDYAWSMAWFKGKLYVGTSRNEACVENATVDFYFPFADEYKTTLYPSVHCTKDPYDLDLRAEIWQYTPRTGRWKMVYRAPDSLRNPRARNKRISPDIAYRDMAVVTGPGGRPAMFVSGVSADEYIPELAEAHPPRLLRTYDGIHYQSVVQSSFIVRKTGAFPNHRPIGFRGIVSFKHKLFILASTALTGDGQVFRVDDAWTNHAHFVQVTPPWMDIFELQTYDGDLYVGGADYSKGYYIYKTSGTGHAPYKFKPVVTGGAGRGKYITSAIAMNQYRGWLYVSAVGWYCTSCGSVPLTEMIRLNASGKWQVVVGNPREYGGRMKYPISGLYDGFDNIFNSHIWRMGNSGGAMYAGTLDWAWLLQQDKTALRSACCDYHGLIESVLTGVLGFGVWATCDGYDFFPVTQDAFGVDEYDFGVRNIVGVNGGFYIGSANHAHGTRIYWQPQTACASGVNAARDGTQRGVLTAPQSLMTDVQRHGTVLSWEPSTFATQYEVLRAPAAQIPLTYKDPPVMPGGAMYDDEAPVPTAPGSPHSALVNILAPEQYAPIATTDSQFFVDRTATPGVRYAYEVVARNDFGAQSEPSNVQVVPDPRPAATFGQLESLLPNTPDTPGTPGAFATDLASRRRAGERNVSLSELARLARSSGESDVGLLAQRLERRLQYWDVAGGPIAG
jgi:hypothetical protein